MDGKIVNLAKKIVRYKEHLRLYNDCEDRKLLPQGLYKESSVTFEDKDLRDVCQKFYDFASVAVRSKVKRHLDKSIHKMQNELIYIFFDKNFYNRYFITLEITLIHTVDIEENKYYLNNILEKVIPKSKRKFLQNFF